MLLETSDREEAAAEFRAPTRLGITQEQFKQMQTHYTDYVTGLNRQEALQKLAENMGQDYDHEDAEDFLTARAQMAQGQEPLFTPNPQPAAGRAVGPTIDMTDPAKDYIGPTESAKRARTHDDGSTDEQLRPYM